MKGNIYSNLQPTVVRPQHTWVIKSLRFRISDATFSVSTELFLDRTILEFLNPTDWCNFVAISFVFSVSTYMCSDLFRLTLYRHKIWQLQNGRILIFFTLFLNFLCFHISNSFYNFVIFFQMIIQFISI